MRKTLPGAREPGRTLGHEGSVRPKKKTNSQKGKMREISPDVNIKTEMAYVR